MKKKQKQALGTIRPQKGHTLFEVNKDNGEIGIATFEETTTKRETKNGTFSVRKVIIKENHFYISALNKKNVIKKLNKLIHEAK